MRYRNLTRGAGNVVAVVAALSLAACSSGTTGTPGSAPGSSSDGDCAAYKVYGDLSGKTVTVYTSIASEAEAKPHTDSYKPFERCTGAKIKYEGSREFESQLPIRLAAGNAPDIAYLPQPGLLASLAKSNPGKIVEVGKDAVANVDKYYAKEWKTYGSVDGKYYAVPVGANVKSFVWYSPSSFAEKGYEVPKTWDELMKLTERIAADNPSGVTKPWCVGLESGGATGWPATDWVEDAMLRQNTPEDYDAWVSGQLKFSDPKVVSAIDLAGKILKDPKFVNGGFGDVKTIATTPFTEAGLQIVDGTCYMHRQASFYQANFDKGTTVGEDGDVWAFYLPAKTTESKPILVGGEFAAAFSDRPEVMAFQAFLTSPEWSNEKAKTTPSGGWLSANKNLDPKNLAKPIDRLSFEILQDPKAVVRFDGSDLMPSAIGAGSFWKEMTNWIALDKSTTEVAEAIDRSWQK